MGIGPSPRVWGTNQGPLSEERGRSLSSSVHAGMLMGMDLHRSSADSHSRAWVHEYKCSVLAGRHCFTAALSHLWLLKSFYLFCSDVPRALGRGVLLGGNTPPGYIAWFLKAVLLKASLPIQACGAKT